MDKKIEELNENIEKLIVVIKRANSFHYVFLRGVLWGLGSVVGAAFVAVIIVAILSSIIQSVNDVPILNNIISNLEK
ncbi:MAG: DUF5665 domain-containing protein [Patescibacteria group bacterium]|nr:DUF5665 domain-containing protein [Patescibacteria group bacterium]